MTSSVNINEIIKLNIIQNAKNNGWSVISIDINTFILSKKIQELNKNESDNLIDNLLDIRKFKKIDSNINFENIFKISS